MNLKIEYDRDAWWPALLGEMGVKKDLPRALIEKLTRIYWSSYERASKPYADAESTLAWLKSEGYKLGLVTDTDRRKVPKERRIKRLKLARFFRCDSRGRRGHASHEAEPGAIRVRFHQARFENERMRIRRRQTFHRYQGREIGWYVNRLAAETRLGR